MSPRNEFEQNVPIEEESKEVPLTLGVGGPVVGTAKIGPDGELTGEITFEALRQKLQGDLSVIAIGQTPRENTELERAFPKKTCGCGKYQGCDVCRKYRS